MTCTETDTAVDNWNSGSLQVVGQSGPFQGISLALPFSNFTILKITQHILQVAPNGPRGEIETNNFLQSNRNVFAAGAASKCAGKKINGLVQIAAKFPPTSAPLAALQGRSSGFAVPLCDSSRPSPPPPQHKADVLPCFPFHSKIKNGFNDFWRYRVAGWHVENEIQKKKSLKISSAKKTKTLGSDHFQNSRRSHVLIYACSIPKGTCLFFNLGWARNQQSKLSALKWSRLANNLAWTGVWIVHRCIHNIERFSYLKRLFFD